MDFDALLLSRMQFAFTIAFHILFPAFTIGLAAFLAVPDVIMRALFERGAFTAADAQGAGATLAAYAIGLIPFVLIRSAVATFNARKDTTTPMIAALIGIAVNVALKFISRRYVLVGPNRDLPLILERARMLPELLHQRVIFVRIGDEHL